MQKDTNLEERIQLFMARKHATKALKVIQSNHGKYALDYELHGDL